jgi:hypothetical protein
MKPIICDKTGEIWYTYKEYLGSDNWKRKREFAQMSGRFRCKCCRSVKKLHIHHKTYESIGNEALKDLVILCATCHNLHHSELLDYDKPPLWARVPHKNNRKPETLEDIKGETPNAKPPKYPLKPSFERMRSLNRGRTHL